MSHFSSWVVPTLKRSVKEKGASVVLMALTYFLIISQETKNKTKKKRKTATPMDWIWWNQPSPQAFMRYRMPEGGLEQGEFSRRALRVTSHWIVRQGRLGTRLCGHCDNAAYDLKQLSVLIFLSRETFISMFTDTDSIFIDLKRNC